MIVQSVTGKGTLYDNGLWIEQARQDHRRNRVGASCGIAIRCRYFGVLMPNTETPNTDWFTWLMIAIGVIAVYAMAWGGG